MAIPIWPPELPQRPTQDSFTRGIADGRSFTPMGQGPAKVRRRYTAAVKPVPGAFQTSTDGFYRFERFWEEETQGGSLPFLIIDPMAHGQQILANGMPLLTELGVPILISAWWLVMFGQDAPSATALSGDIYRISFSLNVMP